MDLKLNIFNDTKYKYLPYKKIKSAIGRVFENEGIKEVNVNLIFAEKAFIREMNKEYLGHDHDTDVIAFPMEEDSLFGEIYISVEKAIEQAKDYKVSREEELLRLSVHGALHLAGYKDFTDEQRKKMHQLENSYIKQ